MIGIFGMLQPGSVENAYHMVSYKYLYSSN